MFNKGAGGFYQGIKPRGKPLYTLTKTRPVSLLNDFQNIPGKRVSMELITMMLL